jgi:hypothetical protein
MLRDLGRGPLGEPEVARELLGLAPGARLRGGVELETGRRRVEADRDEVAEVVLERLERVRRRDGRGERRHERGQLGLDDAARIATDRSLEVRVDPLVGDPVRMQAHVVRAAPVLLDADRADGDAVELPAEQPDLAAREQALGSLDVLDRRLDGQDGCETQVGEESQERLRAEGLVDALHAEVLQGGEAVDDEPRVGAAHDLHLERLLERGEGDLDARELRRLADAARYIGEPYGMADRRDVLERRALVAHHVGDRVEHPHPVEVGHQALVVLPDLVRRLLEGDEEAVLAAPGPLAEELERELRLARARRPDDEVGSVGHQPPVQDLVDVRIPRREAGFRRRRGPVHGARPPLPPCPPGRDARPSCNRRMVDAP